MKKPSILLIALSLLLSACGEFGLEGQVIAPTAEPSPTLAPTATPQPEPSPTAVPRVLPRPLYFINARDNQIWRVETDGVTAAPITHELEPVTDLDVSPADGTLVYVANNQLIRSAPDGTDRRVLVDGGWVDPQDPAARYAGRILNPRWRPGGEEIVFGQAGVSFIDADGAGGPRQMIASSPYPVAGPPEGEVAFYEPVNFSPDGRWLLVSRAFFPAHGEYLLFLLNTDAEPIPLYNGTGEACCHPTWVGHALHLANEKLGMFDVGLWRAEVPSGEFVPVISNDFGTVDRPAPADRVFHFVAFPFGDDEQLFAFTASRPNTEELFQTQTLLTLSRIAPDGGITPLRSDRHLIGEALGAPDGSGALIIRPETSSYQAVPTGEILWLAASDSPAVSLGVEGSQLRWGQ